jgi:hypothetical protein
MKKRYIEIVWTPPQQPISERFDRDKFKLREDGGFVKLMNGDELVRIFPAHAVHLIQFGDEVVPDVPATPPGPVGVPVNSEPNPVVVTDPAKKHLALVDDILPSKFQDS